MTPGCLSMPAITSEEVAICGTHRGDTKDAASILGKPAWVRRLISSILTAASMVCGSFCRPSRGPTSISFTWRGKRFMSVAPVQVHDAGDRLAAFHGLNLFRELAYGFTAHGERGDMRRLGDARMTPQAIAIRGRLLLEHVQRGCRDMPGFQQMQQVFLHQMLATRDIDQVGTLLQLAQGFLIEDAGGFRGQRQHADQYTAPAQKFIQ